VRRIPEHAFDLATVLADKAATGTTVSACIPAATKARPSGSSRRSAPRFIEGAIAPTAPPWSTRSWSSTTTPPTTPQRSPERRAPVVDAASVLAHHGEGHGKGEALWKSVHESTGDIVVWVDADIVDFDPDFILGMVGALVSGPEIDFVKGHYHRPEADGIGGGRVTELLARPLLSLYFPELAEIAQPLAGEYAGRRTLLERLPFVVGYGVDVALLIDAMRVAGIERIAQVDLGVRHHRNRTLDELGRQALALGQAILDRAGVGPAPPSCSAPAAIRCPCHRCTSAHRSTPSREHQAPRRGWTRSPATRSPTWCKRSGTARSSPRATTRSSSKATTTSRRHR
jgi:glucosyl-3-phosphoglycerate synthase